MIRELINTDINQIYHIKKGVFRMVSNEEIKRMLDQKRRGIKPKVEQVKHRYENKTQCPSCGTDNPSSASFCIGCGADLSKKAGSINSCPSCGYENPEKAKFCVKCGEKLGELPITEPTPPVTGKTGKVQEIPSKNYKICPTCHNQNPQDAKFCVVCGNTFKEYKKPETVTSKPIETITPEEEVKEEREPESLLTARKVKEEPELDKYEGEPDQPDISSKPPEEDVLPEEPLPEPKSEDVDPVERIKKAKELLDIGAITQEDFDKIKNKYLEEI